MTDYYYDESLSTGLNDGTSVANAWQSWTAMVTGVASLTGADKVYVRTADAGGNLSHALTANTSVLHAGTQSSRFTFEFDDGTVWPTGGGGVFSLELGTTSVARTFTMDRGTIVKSTDGTRRFKIDNVYTGQFASGWIKWDNWSKISDLIMRDSGGSAYSGTLSATNDEALTEYENIRIELATHGSNTVNQQFFSVGGYDANVRIENLEVESLDASTVIKYLFGGVSFGGRLEINGFNAINTCEGLILNKPASASSGVRALVSDFTLSGSGQFVRRDDFDTTDDSLSEYRVLGGVNPYDYIRAADFCYVDYVDSIPSWPYLNAILPDDNGWSCRMFPFLGANHRVMRSPLMRKMYNGAAGTKTVTLELLILDTDTDYDLSNIWIEVDYEKSTDGLRARETSYNSAGGALATGSSGWSVTAFGTDNFNAKKLTITTANSVATDSYLNIYLKTTFDRATDYYLFFCPDPQVT